MAFAATGTEIVSAAETPEHYQVEAKLVSLPASEVIGNSTPGMISGIYTDAEVGKMAANSTNCLSLPSATATEPSASTIAVTKDFNLPDMPKRETGITIKISPDGTSPEASSFEMRFKNVRFEGYADSKASQLLFNTQSLTAKLSVTEKYYAFVLPVTATQPETYDANGRKSASIADANERQLLFVKITRG